MGNWVCRGLRGDGAQSEHSYSAQLVARMSELQHVLVVSYSNRMRCNRHHVHDHRAHIASRFQGPTAHDHDTAHTPNPNAEGPKQGESRERQRRARRRNPGSRLLCSLLGPAAVRGLAADRRMLFAYSVFGSGPTVGLRRRMICRDRRSGASRHAHGGRRTAHTESHWSLDTALGTASATAHWRGVPLPASKRKWQRIGLG